MDYSLLRMQSSGVCEQDNRDIQATLGGDGEAYRRIVHRYQQLIARRMWRFTRDRGQLEEMVADVFVEAYTSLRRYGGLAPFVHWLNTIATRVGYRFWKRRRQLEHEVPLQDWDAPAAVDSDPLEAAEAGERVHLLMAQLPPRDRLVLTLIYLEGLSVAQTAKQTGWSRSMVKVQAHRARNKLKLLLEKVAP